MTCKSRQLNKLLSFMGVSIGGTFTFCAICLHKGEEKFYSKAFMPVISKFVDPEVAHGICLFLTKYELIRCRDSLTREQAAKLETNVFNLTFSNPIGLAAGFDKNSIAIGGLSNYGLGFAEVGTVTPKPQDGNPRKRIFRAIKEKALINRCGFNNKGLDYVQKNLSRQDTCKPMLVGLNLGKNRDTKDISNDYLIGIEKSSNLTLVDYLVINISSPNTVGLRSLQEKKNLEILINDILIKMDNLSIKKPLLVKIAPDLSDDQIKDVVDVITSSKLGNARVDGIILTNTTLWRPEFAQDHILEPYNEAGGLSGQPLRDKSTQVIREFYRLTKGQIPIIGVGGVSSGQDAYDKIKAGASLVQIYTSLTYEGPPIVNKIKRELVTLLERDNLSSISFAVGMDHRESSND